MDVMSRAARYKLRERYQYNDLDRHFTEPKCLYVHKKLPRKLKKKIYNIIDSLGHPLIHTVKTYDLNTMMWYLGWISNPDYRRFLIKKIYNEQQISR